MQLIKTICTRHKYRYGYRLVTAELRWKHALTVNHKKVRKIMSEHKLQAKVRPKKFKWFNKNEVVKKEDLIKRKFRSDKPNEKWFTDVSELNFGERKLYFSAIIDGYNNEIISTVKNTSIFITTNEFN
ncbi:IS3 family transposase [Lysinibacillus xylanilyticus]|uniref:IS3 family transposase n=1 Tax=Lysinibacillus xylanilyticus TaxID=582475 RepID=UPI003D08F978